MLMRALSTLLRMRPRVQRASGIPCALWIWRSRKYSQTSGAMRRENTSAYPSSPRNGKAVVAGGARRRRRASKDESAAGRAVAFEARESAHLGVTDWRTSAFQGLEPPTVTAT